MSDDLVSRATIKAQMLRMGEPVAFGSDADMIDELAQALSEARAEIERLRGELDVANANHRQMATTMADLARKHDALRARVREVAGPFLNIRDQFPESSKLILKKFDGFTPISVTVTKDQFRAARQLMEEVK